MQTSQEVHVSKAYDKSEDFHSTFRTDGRGPKNIGAQGHHVSAYALFKTLIHELTSIDIEEAIIGLIYFVNELIQDNVNLLSKFVSKLQLLKHQLITPQEAMQATSYVKKQEIQQKISNALAFSNLNYLDQLACELAELYLSVRNRQDFVSFPPKGNRNPPSGEGTRIKIAISDLNNCTQQVHLNSFSKDTKDDPKTISKIAISMFQLFWHPKLKEEELFILDSPQKTNEWKTYCRKQGYKIDSQPRTNDLEVLYTVTSNHIDMILSCFPDLRLKQDEIIPAFVRLIAQTGAVENESCHWEMSEQECQEFIHKVIIKTTRPDEQISNGSDISLESSPASQDYAEYDHIISDTPVSEHESDSSYDEEKTFVKKPRLEYSRRS